MALLALSWRLLGLCWACLGLSWGLFWPRAASSNLLKLLRALRASHGLGGLSGVLGGLLGERERERERHPHTRPDDLAHGVEAPLQGSGERKPGFPGLIYIYIQHI